MMWVSSILCNFAYFSCFLKLISNVWFVGMMSVDYLYFVEFFYFLFLYDPFKIKMNFLSIRVWWYYFCLSELAIFSFYMKTGFLRTELFLFGENLVWNLIWFNSVFKIIQKNWIFFKWWNRNLSNWIDEHLFPCGLIEVSHLTFCMQCLLRCFGLGSGWEAG